MSDGRYAMGTVLEISVISDRPEDARREIAAGFATVLELEAHLTRFDPDSELSRLNAAAGQGPRAVGPDLAEILARAVEGATLTRGAFDVTVGPLVAMWMRASERDRAPGPGEIAGALARVGAGRIRLSPPGTVEIPEPGMSIDLGGVAKGFALDRVAAQLRQGGFGTALLQFGESSTWALGAPPGEPGWRLGLRGASGEVDAEVVLRDRAFSVSSSLGQSSEIGGRRYGHVIDPRSGQALARTAQAAVIAPDATLAEMLSTALVVLDADEGMAVVRAIEGVEARTLGGSGVERSSPGWRSATGYRPWSPTSPSAD